MLYRAGTSPAAQVTQGMVTSPQSVTVFLTDKQTTVPAEGKEENTWLSWTNLIPSLNLKDTD